MKLFFLLSAAGAVGLAYLWRIAAVGCAYKAKILCSSWFVCGREIDPEGAPEVSADAYRVLRLFRARVDRASQTVTASWLGARSKTAAFVPGLGAVLVDDGRRPSGIPEPPGGEDAWPGPENEPPALSRLVEDCFTEPNSQRLRRTRAVLVLQDGRLLAERYAPGFSKDSRLPGWSMTKAVMHALVGVLVGEGKLSLDRKNLFPHWEGDPRADITLEDLLRMRSGLHFSENYGDPLSDVNQMLWNSLDACAYTAGRPLGHRPGARWQYASGTTNIISRLVREAVGEDAYPGFPRRALFGPLGMDSALIETDAGGTFVGSSFMFATARDWARFGLFYLDDGVFRGSRLLPEGWVKSGVTPTPQSPDGRYGAHWWLKLQKELGGETEAAYRIPGDAFFALGHEGQTLTIIPSKRLVAVRLGLSIYIDAWDHAAFVAGLLDALA
ncbi:MAG: serine hydrolase [Elusimicrobia bacterium]|nr:serine hydrolase [Elusimicrobiota bacterium]